MESFEAIAKHCETNSRLTKPLIDDFLIYYAVQKDHLEKKMNQKLKQYKHITRNIPSSYVNILKSEYIASQIFRKNGLIGKYLQHSNIKALNSEEYDFLTYQYEHPWRFSFALILHRPAEDFFQMHDVFTGEEYLLYSPGMSRTLNDQPLHLWFNLIAYNGKCWQTYGVIIGFNGFTPDDLFFFATELNPDLEDDEDLVREVEKNPWPFFMLMSRSTIPLTQMQGERLAHHSALDEVSSFPFDQLKEVFRIRWKDGVYELQMEEGSEAPHFAKAYYDEMKSILLRSALTKTGFAQLTETLRQNGMELDPEPMVEVTPGMLLTAQEILRRKINLNPYEERFVDRDNKENEELKKHNHLLQLAMPFINNNEPLDIEKLAAEADVDVEVAKDLLEKVREHIQKLRDKM